MVIGVALNVDDSEFALSCRSEEELLEDTIATVAVEEWFCASTATTVIWFVPISW